MSEVPNKRVVVVGLFVSAGLLFLIAAILMVGNIHDTFKSKMQVMALFDDVSGLQTGNNIWFSGVKIGTVNIVKLYGKSQVMVGLNLEVKVIHFIRKDSKVKVSSDGLIGNKILVIYGGSINSKEVREGDTLDVERITSTEDMINMLQENNKNLLAITNDFKVVSKKLAAGEGTIGKLINESSLFDNLNEATSTLKSASLRANTMMTHLVDFSTTLNRKGTFIDQITSDTVVYNSVKTTVYQLEKIADSAKVFISNLKEAIHNPKSPFGTIMYDEESARHIKEIIKNLESSSVKLDQDLEAAQHNFLLRGFFKKKAKLQKKELSER
jgi:phospholipid/cholesterol/gamma-HCH transport system substrate-binding protein